MFSAGLVEMHVCGGPAMRPASNSTAPAPAPGVTGGLEQLVTMAVAAISIKARMGDLLTVERTTFADRSPAQGSQGPCRSESPYTTEGRGSERCFQAATADEIRFASKRSRHRATISLR